MSNTQYKALSLKKSSLMTHDDIDKLAKLSWIAMGIYQYLLLDGAKSVAELGSRSPKTPYAAISDALDELIAVGLVAEAVGEVSA